MNQTAARFRQPTADEQLILIHLRVRLVTPEEAARFDQRIAAHHYLKSAQVVGEHLRYIVTYQGQWLALAAWCAPAWHLKAREAFIGWSEEQRRTACRCWSTMPACWCCPAGSVPTSSVAS